MARQKAAANQQRGKKEAPAKEADETAETDAEKATEKATETATETANPPDATTTPAGDSEVARKARPAGRCPVCRPVTRAICALAAFPQPT